MARESREVWEERVRRWSESGKSAPAFAAEIGVNASTLTGWRWRLARAAEEGSGGKRRRERPKSRGKQTPASFVELVASIPSEPGAEDRFEIVLGSGRVVRVPQRFDAETLRALVEALEAG